MGDGLVRTLEKESDRLSDILNDHRLKPLELVKSDFLSQNGAEVWIKKEWYEPDSNDPLRTIKRKPAAILFHDALINGYLNKDKPIFTASSGNLAQELGMLLIEQGYKFAGVVPSVTPKYNLEIIKTLGISLIQTEEETTCPREMTVFLTRGTVEKYFHNATNIDQYYNFLNPIAHALTTGKEIFYQTNKEVDYIACSVGSCGTIGGVLLYFLPLEKDVKIIGVQPKIQQGIPGTHIVKGDCAWSPENYSGLLYGPIIEEADRVDSYAFTAKLWEEGINAGPSTGMAAAIAYKLIKEGAKGNIVVTSPDNNFKYSDLIKEELIKKKDKILERYPELELSWTIDKYISNLELKAGIDYIIKRVKECYKPTIQGKIYNGEEFESIAGGKTPLEVGKITIPTL